VDWSARNLLASVRRSAFVVLMCAASSGCGAGAPDSPRHLILISADTLRADHLGSYGHTLGLTPVLDALADESTRFERAYATAPFTLPSVASLHTGRHPEELGIRGNIGRLPGDVTTLAEAFRARGFGTAAAVGNFVLRPVTGLDRGFDLYDASFPQREGGRGVPERVAGSTTDAALAALDTLLERGAERTFLWVHYQDPHGPYTPPPGLRERYLQAEREAPGGTTRLQSEGGGGIPPYQRIGEEREVAFYRAGYDGEIAYMDAEIGRLLEEVGRRGLLETSAVVFTADHGEALGERGYWFAHGERLDEAALRVPLLLRIPGAPVRARFEIASLVDLAPTLAELFGLELAGLSGRDLGDVDAPERGAYFVTTRKASSAERAGLARGDYLYVRSGEGDPEEQLFHLPDEGRNLAAARPEALRELRDAFATRRDALDRRDPAPRRAPDAAETEALRALGYGD
jgi:arylsulfatase